MSSKRGKVLAVVGAQYGSEGKGVIVAKIANNYDIHVRTGGPNAGHTFMHKDKKFVMQTVPCGWVNPEARLILGAGALISLDNLFNEIEAIRQVDPSIVERLMIDANAGVITDLHHDEEGGIEGDIHKRIGSTGKGVGAARRDRVMRDPEKLPRIKDIDFRGTPVTPGMIKEDTAMWMNKSIDNGGRVLLEGTQGQGLDLIHGPWPFVTSNGCSAAQLLADAGIGATRLTDVLLVARTFPIRVAGNSGPMEGEVDWDYISERVGYTVTEKTTVTKKVRRIAKWDDALFARSVALNDATHVALTFMDYLNPVDEGKTSWASLSPASREFVEFVEIKFGVRVNMIGTGGLGWNVIVRSTI